MATFILWYYISSIIFSVYCVLCEGRACCVAPGNWCQRRCNQIRRTWLHLSAALYSTPVFKRVWHSHIERKGRHCERCCVFCDSHNLFSEKKMMQNQICELVWLLMTVGSTSMIWVRRCPAPAWWSWRTQTSWNFLCMRGFWCHSKTADTQ